jgi:hypothetical protein
MLTQTEPPAEATHWTSAMMAKVVDISASYRDNNAGRILLPQCFNRGVHGGPGRQAVVPQNNSAAANIGRRTTSAVKPLASCQLLQFTRRDRIGHLLGNAETFDELVVEHAHATRRDRTHGQLLVAGDAELADDKNVKRRAERTRHFVTDGTPPRGSASTSTSGRLA